MFKRHFPRVITRGVIAFAQFDVAPGHAGFVPKTRILRQRDLAPNALAVKNSSSCHARDLSRPSLDKA
jgi:hypothetical protein